MPTIPLIYTVNHMFVDLPEGRWLVDTAAPTTFGTPGTITWGNTRRQVPTAFGPVTINQIQQHVRTPLVGLIGCDLLNEQDLCWDGPRGECRFGPEEAPAGAEIVPLGDLMGAPTIEVLIAGQRARCLLDTGAQFGFFLRRTFADGALPDGRIADFNPIIGAIDCDAWTAEVTLGALRVRERFGLLEGMPAMMLTSFGIDAIIGCSWLPGLRVWYRPSERTLIIDG